MPELSWPQPVTNDMGEFCDNSQEFFNGSFFDAEGGLSTTSYAYTCHTDSVQDKFRYNALIPSRSLEHTIPFLEENDRAGFLSIVQKMLTWLPEGRKTARELMDHPFLRLDSP